MRARAVLELVLNFLFRIGNLIFHLLLGTCDLPKYPLFVSLSGRDLVHEKRLQRVVVLGASLLLAFDAVLKSLDVLGDFVDDLLLELAKVVFESAMVGPIERVFEIALKLLDSRFERPMARTKLAAVLVHQTSRGRPCLVEVTPQFLRVVGDLVVQLLMLVFPCQSLAFNDFLHDAVAFYATVPLAVDELTDKRAQIFHGSNSQTLLLADFLQQQQIKPVRDLLRQLHNGWVDLARDTAIGESIYARASVDLLLDGCLDASYVVAQLPPDRLGRRPDRRNNFRCP
mmetsp:Transcript_115118/g.325284  ORF Transcript_115118/g.325284 Transcript_115118/m.325284 type:complete len:285 (+) Transcript_115118:1393-2247(+)